MNPESEPPKLPDPDFVPQNWRELAAHYHQCIAALDHQAAELRRNADCLVVGPCSLLGRRHIHASILLCRVMERDLRELRRQGEPEPQRDVDVILPRVIKARRAWEALC